MRLLIPAAMVAVAAIAVLSASLWLVRDDDGRPFTAEGVFGRVEAALAGNGAVVHSSFSYADQQPYDERVEAWVDARGKRARIAKTYDFGEGDVVSFEILARGEWYRQRPDNPGEVDRTPALECEGSPPDVVTVYYNCYSQDEIDVSAQVREFKGVRVIAVRSSGSFFGIDSRLEVDDLLYVDPDTWLPVASQHHLLDYYGNADEAVASNNLVSYTHEFINPESLPEEFFDPASVALTSD